MSELTSLKPYFDQYGYWAVFGAILGEGLGIPLPGETLLIAGSLLASQGALHIIPLLFAAWTAAFMGNQIGYLIGWFGRPLVIRYGRYILINETRLGYVEAFFRRHGGIVVIFARFLDVFRQLNGIVAGITKMPLKEFVVFNAFGSTLWVGFWGVLFYELGERAHSLGKAFQEIELFIAIGVIFVVSGIGAALVRYQK
jgi:membrane protein DedA with SNARE-associated domain